MQRFHPHDEPWGAFVDVKVNAVEVLKRQLRRAEPGEVFVEQRLRRLAAGRGPVPAHAPLLRAAAGTRLRGPRADQERAGPPRSRHLRRPPGAGRRHGHHARRTAARTVGAGGGQRRRAVRRDRRGAPGGHSRRPSCSARCCRFFPTARRPSTPCCGARPTTGSRADLGRRAQSAAARVARRGRVAPRSSSPICLEGYRRILFDKPARTAYLKELHGRVDRAAERPRAGRPRDRLFLRCKVICRFRLFPFPPFPFFLTYPIVSMERFKIVTPLS